MKTHKDVMREVIILGIHLSKKIKYIIFENVMFSCCKEGKKEQLYKHHVGR